MTNKLRGLLAGALGMVAATAAVAAHPRVYILNGYSFGGMPGVNTVELTTKLKDQAGARVTQADIAEDEAIVATALKDQHVKGRLFTTLAEKHGRVWVIFDVLDPDRPTARAGKAEAGERLKVQNFEGATGLSTTDLAAATGLKPGAPLSAEVINGARQSIIAAYAKAMPGKAVSIRGKLQFTPEGEVTLTWIIGDK